VAWTGAQTAWFDPDRETPTPVDSPGFNLTGEKTARAEEGPEQPSLLLKPRLVAEVQGMPDRETVDSRKSLAVSPKAS
jgi:hypothetical protein